jgi:hypothetical protein
MDPRHDHLADGLLRSTSGRGKRTGSNLDTAPRPTQPLIEPERQSVGQIVCRTDSFRDRGPRQSGFGDAEVVGSAYPKKMRSSAATRSGVPVSAAAV